MLIQLDWQLDTTTLLWLKGGNEVEFILNDKQWSTHHSINMPYSTCRGNTKTEQVTLSPLLLPPVPNLIPKQGLYSLAYHVLGSYIVWPVSLGISLGLLIAEFDVYILMIGLQRVGIKPHNLYSFFVPPSSPRKWYIMLSQLD